MRTTERLFVYGTLAALGAAFFLRGTERAADATARPAPSDLGPADAVILSGKDANLSLRNDGGRIAFGEQPTAKVWSMGAVNSDKVMKLLLKSVKSLWKSSAVVLKWQPQYRLCALRLRFQRVHG